MEPVRLSDDSSNKYRCHIRATKLHRTPNVKEGTSMVRMRQYLDVVVGLNWWRHRETIAQGLCEVQPTRFTGGSNCSTDTRGPCDHNSR